MCVGGWLRRSREKVYDGGPIRWEENGQPSEETHEHPKVETFFIVRYKLEVYSNTTTEKYHMSFECMQADKPFKHTMIKFQTVFFRAVHQVLFW